MKVIVKIPGDDAITVDVDEDGYFRLPTRLYTTRLLRIIIRQINRILRNTTDLPVEEIVED